MASRSSEWQEYGCHTGVVCLGCGANWLLPCTAAEQAPANGRVENKRVAAASAGAEGKKNLS